MPVLRTRRFLRVKLDMVGRCQLRCIMCHFAHPQFQENPVTMDRALLEKVAADLFPRAHDVVLSSSAEPLLSPDLPRALELCREHDVPLFHFSTNAIGLTNAIMEKLVDVQMPVLTISVDGATKETFEAIRPPMKWEKLLQKLELVREVKARRRSAFPKVSITCVLMRRNIREAPELVRLMHRLGAEHINLVHMGVVGGLGVEDESLVNDPALSNRMLAEAHAVADGLGLPIVMPLPFPEGFGRPVEAAEAAITDATRAEAGGVTALGSAGQEAPSNSFTIAEFMNHKIQEFGLAAKFSERHDRRCYFPWYYIHINPDGTVFPCGCWFEFSTFGDFRTQSFREIWTGGSYRELRRQIRDMELRDVCANCSVANMGRPDVLASFSHRAKVRRAARSAALS